MNEVILQYDGAIQTFGGLITLLLDLLVIVLILKETPKTMGVYKWLLLNVEIADLSLAILVLSIQPTILTANAAVMLQGPVKYLGPAFAIPAAMLFMALVAWTGLGLAICFVYRYATIANDRLSAMILERRAAAFASGFVIFACVAYATCTWYVLDKDYDLLLDLTRAANPKLREFESELLVFGMAQQNAEFGQRELIVVLIVVTTLFSIVICMLTAFITAKLRQSRASMTPNTYKLQQQLVISLSLECLYPVVFDAAPICLAASCYVFGCSTQSTDNDTYDWIALCCLDIAFAYSAFDSIVTIAFIGPYRRAVQKYCRKIVDFGASALRDIQPAKLSVTSVTKIVQPRQLR